LRIIRRSAVVLALVTGTLGSVGFVSLAMATPSNAQPACTDNWVGPSTGTTNWNASASNWSSGIPNGSSVVCINEAGTYTVSYSTTSGVSAVVVGGAASGVQTLEVNGANLSTSQNDEVENGGVLSLVPTASSAADITGGGSNGLTIDAGGSLTSSGTTEQADVGLALDNQGTVSLGATTTVDGWPTTNDGSFVVSSSSAAFDESGGFTDAAGTLVNDGSFTSQGETFTQSGTTGSGNPVLQSGGTFVDSAGTGSFVAYQSTIEGTVPVGQTLTNLASPGNSNDTIGSSSEGITVDGTLICQTVTTVSGNTICSFSTPNPTEPGITVATGGTLETTGPGSASSCGNVGCVNLDALIQIEPGGTATIANPITNDNSDQITDDGTLQVTATGGLVIGGNTVVDSASGTIGVTDGAGALGTISITSGGMFTCGTLAVDTVGSPGGETVISTRSGNGCMFTSYSFGPDYYTVTYPENVSFGIIQTNVTPGTPFSASMTAFSAAENEPATTPEVALFNTNGEPGTYSATVNYGDGSSTQAATVNLNGSSGTVAGPTHTYAAPGSYTVTVVVSTTAGTTETTSGSVTVTGPTVTGFTKTAVAPGKKFSTKISGTNFDQTGAPSGFTTSDPTNLSVVSVTVVKATKKHGVEYKVKFAASKTAPSEQVSITLTQSGGAEPGIATATNAITIS
jgi:PKD domain